MLRLPAEHGKHIRARWQQAWGVEDDDDDDDGGGGGYIRETTRIMVKE
jgi:hypothetical protein